MSEETGGGGGYGIVGRTSALDYFKKYSGNIGGGSESSDSAQVGGDNKGRVYWFIYGRQGSKQVLAGPYSEQGDARKAAGERFSGWAYKILGMPTKDRGRARRMLAHEVAKGGSVADGLKRMQREV